MYLLYQLTRVVPDKVQRAVKWLCCQSCCKLTGLYYKMFGVIFLVMDVASVAHQNFCKVQHRYSLSIIVAICHVEWKLKGK